MADIPPYESPPTTPPNTHQIDQSQGERNTVLQAAAHRVRVLEKLKKLDKQLLVERARTQRLRSAIPERDSEACSRIKQGEPAPIPQSNLPRFYAYDIEASLLPLTERYPAINPEYFQEIFENRFKPENLSKLSDDFSTSCQSTKKQIGTRTVNVEEDAAPEAIHDLQYLCHCFDKYTKILLHVTSILRPRIQHELRVGLVGYRQYLVDTTNRDGHTFDSVRTFHLAFHKKRAIFGIDDGLAWVTPDTSLKCAYLKKRN